MNGGIGLFTSSPTDVANVSTSPKRLFVDRVDELIVDQYL